MWTDEHNRHRSHLFGGGRGRRPSRKVRGRVAKRKARERLQCLGVGLADGRLGRFGAGLLSCFECMAQREVRHAQIRNLLLQARIVRFQLANVTLHARCALLNGLVELLIWWRWKLAAIRLRALLRRGRLAHGRYRSTATAGEQPAETSTTKGATQ